MRRQVFAIALALLCSLAGLSTLNAQPGRPEVRVRLHFSRAADLDPVYNQRSADYFVCVNLFSHLARWRPGGTDLEPDLAERWEASPDGRVWTFHLRKGIQFHRGYGEVTSEDVKFTFERFLDPNVASPSAGEFEGIGRIEAVDRYTVRFVLKEPSKVFVANPVAGRSALIVSRKAVLEKQQNFSRDPIGSGPFAFQAWTSTDEIVMSAHDRYFHGAPKVSKITFVPIPEETVAVAALERGEIHAMWTRGNVEAERLLRANKDVTVELVRRPNAIRYLAVNPRYAPLADVRVRRALAYAINKKELGLASAGQLVAADHLLPDLPWLRDAAQAGKFPTYRYDPARAKRLLADAGQAGLRVTLMFQLAAPGPLIAQVVAEQLRRAGIDVQLEGLEQRAWNTRWRNAQFQLTPASLGRGLDPDEIARDLFHTSSFPPGRNSFRYDRADRLIEAATVEGDAGRRQALYLALMNQVMGEVPYIPLANDAFIAAWRAPVKRVLSGFNNEFYGFTIEPVGR